MRRPPQMRMQNGPTFIFDQSFLGGGSREGVFHKLSDIYTPHTKTASYQGMLNRYFPSREMPQRWRASACPGDPCLGGGGWGVVYLPCTLQHGDSNTPLKRTTYITCGISSTCATPSQNTVRSRYVLG